MKQIQHNTKKHESATDANATKPRCYKCANFWDGDALYHVASPCAECVEFEKYTGTKITDDTQDNFEPNVYFIKKNNIRALARADSIMLKGYKDVYTTNAHDCHISCYIMGETKPYHRVPCELRIEDVAPKRYCLGQDGECYKSGTAHLHDLQHNVKWQTIVSFLRKGDVLEIRFRADCDTNAHCRQKGLHADRCELYIVRDDTEYAFVLQTQVSPDNTARMCRYNLYDVA